MWLWNETYPKAHVRAVGNLRDILQLKLNPLRKQTHTRIDAGKSGWESVPQKLGVVDGESKWNLEIVTLKWFYFSYALSGW